METNLIYGNKMETTMTAEHLYNLAMVFEKTTGWNFDEVTLTHRMLLILAHINGKRSLANIYESLKLTYETLFSDLQHLHDLHLIKNCGPGGSRAGSTLSATENEKRVLPGNSF
jgi:hypothetical protein